MFCKYCVPFLHFGRCNLILHSMAIKSINFLDCSNSGHTCSVIQVFFFLILYCTLSFCTKIIIANFYVIFQTIWIGIVRVFFFQNVCIKVLSTTRKWSYVFRSFWRPHNYSYSAFNPKYWRKWVLCIQSIILITFKNNRNILILVLSEPFQSTPRSSLGKQIFKLLPKKNN